VYYLCFCKFNQWGPDLLDPLNPSLPLWWPSLKKGMQTEQLLCWSGMTQTQSIRHLLQTKKKLNIVIFSHLTGQKRISIFFFGDRSDFSYESIRFKIWRIPLSFWRTHFLNQKVGSKNSEDLFFGEHIFRSECITLFL